MILILALLISLNLHAADDVDNSMSTIHKIDMTDDSPKSPNYVLTVFDVKALRVPGSSAHAILRQLNKRVRAEFEATGIPKGKYKLAISLDCSGKTRLTFAAYKKTWTELHSFKMVSTHIATEKSHYEMSLRPSAQAKTSVLEGKALALFHIEKGGMFNRVDCKTIQ
jgi:hypothetical protein